MIDDHTKIPYTSSATDTWDVLEEADQDPEDPNNILDLYRNTSLPKQGGGNSFYNREHSWPKSYGFPNDNAQNYPYTDCHALFLCDSGYNSSRGNKPYRFCSVSCTEKRTEENGDAGGGIGVYPGNSSWTSGAHSEGGWETWTDRRGDVARALFYLDVRYEGGSHGVTGAGEPDLVLTDDVASIAASNTENNESRAFMGLLSVLLTWHQQDPVDAKERLRNDAVFRHQGNRNPFIDNPDWVGCLFGTQCGGGGTVVPVDNGRLWINEIHYDNTGADAGEFVEVAGRAGLVLDGWTLVGYNGRSGASYRIIALSGTIPNQSNGFGTRDFDFRGLQNGPSDGIALVSPSNDVVEFLSYEGSLTATNGPANGMMSVEIGVAETGSTPTGHSLQRQGSGQTATSFTWNTAAAAT